MAFSTANSPPIVEPAQPRAAKRMMAIFLIAFMAAITAAFGAYLYLFALNHDGSGVVPFGKSKSAPAPFFLALEPMTVNLLTDDEPRYLRVGLTLKLADEKMQTHLSKHMPELRSRILLALSNKHAEALLSLNGKHTLATELKTLIEQLATANALSIPIEAVLFTEFIVQ